MNPLLLLLIIGLICSAFASTAETALTSVSRIRIRSLAEEGDKRAKRLLRLHNNPNAYLSTILAINTVAVIVASSAATVMTVEDAHYPEALVTVVLSIIVLVFCEIAPKSLALRHNERVSLLSSRPASAKLCPSRNSTPVLARRVFSAGIRKPSNFTPFAKSIVETSGSSSSR